jgi:DNA gyrase/topoisomerase IV subunit A
LEHPKKTDARSIAKIIKGPDFAAGGTIIANCQELDKCYNEGEGTIMHKCDIIADKQIIRLAVLEPKFALQQLDAAINERKISGISSVTQHGSEVVATIEKGADLLSVKSRIHELPGFTTAINFDMTVVVGEREKYGDHSIYVASDGLPAIDIVKSRLPIDEIFQAFIERRLRFLREIHEINKTKAVSRMQNELLEFKRNYGQPRRTRIEIAK